MRGSPVAVGEAWGAAWWLALREGRVWDGVDLLRMQCAFWMGVEVRAWVACVHVLTQLGISDVLVYDLSMNFKGS